MTTRRKTRRASTAQSCPTPISDQRPTVIEFLLDETGSMSSILSATIGGFNDFLADQRTAATGDTCLLTLTKFDNTGLKTPFVDLDIGMVPDLNTSTYLPSGGTNLRDTVLARVAALRQRLSTWDVLPRVLFVVMTDGEDTCSRHGIEETCHQVCAAQGLGWQLVYLGAHDSAASVGRLLGFPESSIMSFAKSRMRESMQDLATATTAFRTASSTASPFFNQAHV